MKKTVFSVVTLLFLTAIYLLLSSKTTGIKSPVSVSPSASVPTNISVNDAPKETVLLQELDTPWAIALLPVSSESGTSSQMQEMLITERSGVVHYAVNGEMLDTPAADISSVKEIGEGGLLGITLHPSFTTNKFVYLYYTYNAQGNNTLNRVVRMTFNNGKLEKEQVILDGIPGASNHDGGRIKFGPDGFLYIGTGDAQEPSRAQDKNSLAGKILRVTDEGKPAPGNPFVNATYSYGHRNVQGLAWDKDGRLWATEHGRSGAASGLDELNLIESGKNYGWPEIEGDEKREGMVSPKQNSGATDTWAPSGMAFYNGSMYFSGLRGTALYEAVLSGDTVAEFKTHFKGEFGRIREVVLGTDNLLYITTSNRDGRGSPSSTDDRVIKINPKKL